MKVMRVVAHGAGIRLPSRSSVATIASGIQRVIDDPAYRAAAGRLADAITDEDPGRRGPEELERLADPR